MAEPGLFASRDCARPLLTGSRSRTAPFRQLQAEGTDSCFQNPGQTHRVASKYLSTLQHGLILFGNRKIRVLLASAITSRDTTSIPVLQDLSLSPLCCRVGCPA